MSVIFIGGSRRLSRINNVIRGRLDNIINRNHSILIGDANGGDRAVQAYLAEKSCRAVTVYCTNGQCRNNVGQWPIKSIPAAGQRGFDFYALKDAAMAHDAECGFMLWDGKSKGTQLNIQRLLAASKPVVVYLTTDQTCHTLRQEAELDSIAVAPIFPRQPDAKRDRVDQGTLFSPEQTKLVSIQLDTPVRRKRRVAQP